MRVLGGHAQEPIPWGCLPCPPSTVALADPDVTIHHGDSLTVLRTLPDASVDCVITSPPYFGLRDYGVDGQIGLEATPTAYLEAMVGVFREVRRVLASHGTCWVNMGDSYATAADGSKPHTGSIGSHQDSKRVSRSIAKLGKPKDLLGMPWRLALALQADGWWLRSEIIWAKPNPMPESVTDRPTKAHETVFLLTKAAKYWFDQEAVREPHQEDGRRKTTVQKGDGSIQHRNGERWPGTGRNMRTVWDIPTQPFPDAHFATFPEELVRRALLAGCPERVCVTCGRPSERIVARELVKTRGNASPNTRTDPMDSGSQHTWSGGVYGHYDVTTTGWTDCGHDQNYRPGIVLDPFIGSGTTALVARNHARHCVGIELNPEYIALASRRLGQQSLLAEHHP